MNGILRIAWVTLERVEGEVMVNYILWSIKLNKVNLSVIDGYSSLWNFKEKYNFMDTLICNSSPSTLKFFSDYFVAPIRGCLPPSSIDDFKMIIDDPQRQGVYMAFRSGGWYPGSAVFVNTKNDTGYLPGISFPFTKTCQDKCLYQAMTKTSLFIYKSPGPDTSIVWAHPRFKVTLNDTQYKRLWNLLFSFSDDTAISEDFEVVNDVIYTVTDDLLCSILRLSSHYEWMTNDQVKQSLGLPNTSTYKVLGSGFDKSRTLINPQTL
jgi:hypothetical protein